MSLGVGANSFSEMLIDDSHVHMQYAIFIDTYENQVTGDAPDEACCVPEADCFACSECCDWDIAFDEDTDGRLVLDNDEFKDFMTSSFEGLDSSLIRSDTALSPLANKATLELLESLCEHDDGQRENSDQCSMQVSKRKFDRGIYRKWIGARSLHAH
jgi:hypothetical protein